MKKFLKWSGIIFGGLVGLLLLAGAALYPGGMKQLSQAYPGIAVEQVDIPTGAEAVARGRHVAVIWACTKCHGADLSGMLFTDDPLLGTIVAPNLTAGKGGLGVTYTDADWVRAIRHGVKPGGRVEMFMYESYAAMSDRDLGDLVAYLKQAAPVDTGYPAARYGPVIPIAAAVGLLAPAAGRIDHQASRAADPAPGATSEYGKYLSVLCSECHGSSGPGKIKQWGEEDFIRTMRSGVLPGGKKLGRTMSADSFRELDELELAALWTYYMGSSQKSTK